MKNFFSHRDSFIDFSQFNAALLIGNTDGNYDISNGSGKSAILEGILWALFNKSRAAAMDDIIFWGENTCRVSFIFKHQGETYRIIRKRTRITSTSSVELGRMNDVGAWIDISGTTSGLTNEKIVSTIKLDSKTFVNTAYFRQNDISEFAESDAATKKEILKSIIDISKWDEYEKSVKTKIKDLRAEVAIIATSTDVYADVVEQANKAFADLAEQRDNLEANKKQQQEMQVMIESLDLQYQGMKKNLDTDSWDKATSDLQMSRNTLAALTKKLEVLDVNFQKYQSLIKNKENLLMKEKEQVLNLSLDEDVDNKIEENNRQLIEFKTNLSVSKEAISNLKEWNITSGSCYVCEQQIDDNLHKTLVQQHLEKIEKHKQVSIYSQNKINEFTEKNKNLSIIKENNNKRLNILNKINSIETDISLSKERFEEIIIDKNSITNKIISCKQNITISEKLLDSIRDDSFKNLQKEINLMKKQKDSLITIINSNNLNIGILTEKSLNFSKRIAELEIMRIELTEKQKKIITFEKLSKLFGKNGIQTILLNAVIDDLEKTANDILTSICHEPFVIYLETQRQGSDGVSVVDTLDLKVKKDGIIQNFRSLSGGEQFRISLALRIALSEISSRHGGSSLEFLLLDEINSPLDKQGTDSLFINIIKSLEKKYKILVITHNESLKEKFDNIIDIAKINGESYISYVSA